MLNILRSDLYRLIRGKCIYITFLIYLVFTGVQIAFPGEVTIGFSPEIVPGVENLADKVTGISAPFIAMTYTDNIIYFMLAILFALTAADFTSGAVKNTLAGGISRTSYYFSKLLLALFLCTLMFIGGILVSVLISTAMHGWGGAIPKDYLLSVLRPFGAQLLLLAAAVSVGTAVVFITKNGASSIALYLFFFLGLTMIAFLLGQISDDMKVLMNYDFIVNLKMLASVNVIPAGDTVRALSLGVACIAASIILGMFSFRRSVIK